MADPKSLGQEDEEATLALLVRLRVPDQPAVLHALTRVIPEHRANITYVDIGDPLALTSEDPLHSDQEERSVAPAGR